LLNDAGKPYNNFVGNSSVQAYWSDLLHGDAKKKKAHADLKGGKDIKPSGSILDEFKVAREGKAFQTLNQVDKDKLAALWARWILKRDRPFGITQNDTELTEVIEALVNLFGGTYKLPSQHTIDSEVNKQSRTGLQHAINFVAMLQACGLKPSMGGDIWSDGGVSLLGGLLYGIDKDWNMQEVLGFAVPFECAPSHPPPTPCI
jgi:hypothetical protein